MKTDEDKSLVAERPAGNSRQRRGRPAWKATLRGLGGVVCRRESEGFYDRGGGFSDSGRKVLIPGVMVAIVNIST